ncbi:MAG: hypothetical protein ABJQ71_12475 [Roseibium sp.]
MFLKTRWNAIVRILLLSAAFAAQMPNSSIAQAALEQDAGWQSDVNGLRHFTGMRCPDTIGVFYRIKVMEGDGASLAGCIYTGRDGITAVLRMHNQGGGRHEARKFSQSYKTAGFEQIELTGAPSSGISFRTRSWTPSKLCETLWYFSGKKADFTLWMSYNLPTQKEDVGPALDSFVGALTRQN